MTRPSQNIDRILIETALTMIPQAGFSGLKVRALARKAGVNPGMFTYHFKTKDRFIECILSTIYEKFFAGFSLEAHGPGTPVEQLRGAVIAIARFVRDNRALLAPLIEELAFGNRKIFSFAKKNMTGHVLVLIGLIQKCQKQGLMVSTPVMNILPVLLAAIAGPGIFIRFAEKNAQRGLLRTAFVKSVSGALLSDKAIAERIDIVLKGLAPGGVR